MGYSNLSRVKEGTGNHIGYIFEYFTEFLGSFAICFYYDWRLTLIGMVLTPLIVLLGVFDTKVPGISLIVLRIRFRKLRQSSRK